MKIIAYFLLFSLLSFFSCSDKDDSDNSLKIRVEKDASLYSIKDIQKALETAYLNQDEEMLKQLLDKWTEESKPNAQKYIDQHPAVRTIYDIYKDYYDPFDKDKYQYTSGEAVSTTDYAFIQNNISFFVAGSVEEYNYWADEDRYFREEDEYEVPDFLIISNFKPPVNLKDKTKKAMYLTNEHKQAFLNFFGVEEDGEWGIPDNREEIDDKVNFVRKYLRVTPTHWVYSFKLLTAPEVYLVILHPELDQAIVSFQNIFLGSRHYLSKSENYWQIDSMGRMWTE